jgi:hypothetical protein
MILNLEENKMIIYDIVTDKEVTTVELSTFVGIQEYRESPPIPEKEINDFAAYFNDSKTIPESAWKYGVKIMYKYEDKKKKESGSQSMVFMSASLEDRTNVFDFLATIVMMNKEKIIYDIRERISPFECAN